MKQYMDNNGKWHIVIDMTIPLITIKNYLNYRIYSLTDTENLITRDPVLSNSISVFHIESTNTGKSIDFEFDVADIRGVKDFVFGLCDEHITWFDETFIRIDNEYSPTNIITEKITDNTISEQTMTSTTQKLDKKVSTRKAKNGITAKTKN